jgi:hypothetical protein
MTIKQISILLSLATVCLLGSGCRLAQNAWWTTVSEPIHYPRNVDQKLSKKRFQAMAESALDEARSTMRAELDDYAIEPFTVDHELGFVDGYVDYLEAGGTGDPPPLPPRRYWKGKYQNPYGYERMQEWFRGYEHGALAARDSNYRMFVTVPLSDAVTWQTEQSTYGRISAAEPAGDERQERADGDRFALRPSGAGSEKVAPLPARSDLRSAARKITK